MTPFKIEIPQTRIDDLKSRLAKTRFPDEVEDAGWDYGTNLAFLRTLIDYWQNHFDWKAEEVRLNRFDQFTTTIDGERVHFVHMKGNGAAAVPILLANGWPSNFVELLPLVPALTTFVAGLSFDVVIPSLPGYGFSSRPARRGMNLTRTAGLWAALMTELGYGRFLFSGSDMGAGVGLALVRHHPDRLIGAHWCNVYSQFARPADPTPEEQDYFRKVDYWMYAEGAYAMQQGTKPTTLAVGLNDSPAGLASWIVEKFRSWSDCGGDLQSAFGFDALCSILCVYWFTETIGSSVRLYKEAFADQEFRTPQPPHKVRQAVMVPADCDLPAPRAWGERHLQNIVQWTRLTRGGHFPALEATAEMAADIRTFAHTLGRG